MKTNIEQKKKTFPFTCHKAIAQEYENATLLQQGVRTDLCSSEFT